jgi:polysaccharide export outer membrane protein
MKKLPSSLLRPFLVTLLSLLAGCAGYVDLPPGTVKMIGQPLSSPVVERETVIVQPPVASPPPSGDYVIGANDVLYVNVSGRPEFMVIGPSLSTKIQGSRVDGNGDIQLPLAGLTHVAGLTMGQAQEKIREIMKKYLKEPWVVVEIAEYKSHSLYLLGEFRASGTYYMDRPLNLLQGIAIGNGFSSTADLRGARLTRGGRIVPVDVYELVTKGDSAQNVWLETGDTIFIPDNTNRQVFVFGAVKKPGPVPILQGGLNLAQAIGSAELRDTGYDFRHVRIIRSISTNRGELLVVDFDRILRGEALPLPLTAGDIIYVPRSNMGAWNDAIAEILPSLQAIGAVLQPFVNVKYLSQ